MALNTLQEILSKKGEDFLNKLFTMNVAIYEKFSGSSFSFEIRNKKIYFYRKDNSKPLNKIDRTINRYYEQPISYITNIKSKILLSLPEYHRFNFEYFPNKMPNYISYDKLPKNNLILMNIVVKSEDDKNIKIINDIETIKEYAEMLNVNSFPIFFNGKLNNEQIFKIKEYVKHDSKNIKKVLNDKSFIEYLISILDINIKTTHLNTDLKKSIEGIIFLFYDEVKKEKVYAKLIDPVFDEIVSNNKDTQYQDDLISILNSKIIEFMEMEKNNFNTFQFKDTELDDKYIEFISHYFNLFIDKNTSILKDLKITLPKYLVKPEFDLNDLNVKNHKTFQLVNSSKTYREIFKLFLLLFKQKKKKSDEFIMDSVLVFQNQLFDTIFDTLEYDESNDLANSYQDDLDGDSNGLDGEEGVLGFDTELVEEKVNDITNMKIISLWQKMFDNIQVNENLTEDEERKEVILVVDEFQPFNNNHLDMCQKIYETSNTNIILVQINNNKSYKPISVETSKTILSNVVHEYDFFDAFLITKKNSIENIIENLDTYKINKIYTNNKYMSYFKNQVEFLNYNYIFENFNSLNEYINIDLISSIKENDFLSYKRNVPECIHNLFEIIKKDIEDDK